jgi:hypothetical protein
VKTFVDMVCILIPRSFKTSFYIYFNLLPFCHLSIPPRPAAPCALVVLSRTNLIVPTNSHGNRLTIRSSTGPAKSFCLQQSSRNHKSHIIASNIPFRPWSSSPAPSPSQAHSSSPSPRDSSASGSHVSPTPHSDSPRDVCGSKGA